MFTYVVGRDDLHPLRVKVGGNKLEMFVTFPAA